MRIAVCDDERTDRNQIISFIKQYSIEHEIVEFSSANTLLSQIDNGIVIDLLFLDIQMPDSNGWDIAKLLKQSNSKLYIAMITVMNDYIHTCFDRVNWFAAKPTSREQIFQILEDAHSKLFPKKITFQTEKVAVSLFPSEIRYIEVKANTSHVRARNKEYSLRMPLKEIYALLADEPSFVQSHQSFIVNLEYKKDLHKNEIVLNDNTVIPISRTYRERFYNSLAEHIKRR